MTPEERQLVTGLFERLRQTDHGDRDQEAQQLIEAGLQAHPGAPYLMTQLLLVQDRALSAAQEQIRRLQQDLASARNTAGSGATDGSFLTNTPPRGPWSRGTTSTSPAAAAPPTPQPQSVAASGGGFLRGALQTAAGVAGGALLFEGISSLFRMGGGGWGHGLMPGSFLGGGGPTLVEETVINDYGSQTPFEPTPAMDDGRSLSADDLQADDLDGLSGDDTDTV